MVRCWATQQRQWASIGVIDYSACIAHPEANYLHVHEHHVWNKDILILLVVIVIATISVNTRGYCDWPAIGALNAQLTLAGEISFCVWWLYLSLASHARPPLGIGAATVNRMS